MDELDRFSQGLVREELRRSNLLHSRDNVREFINEIVRRNPKKHLYGTGSINEATLKTLRYTTMRDMRKSFNVFKEQKRKVQLIDGPSRPVDSFFYWSPRKLAHEDATERDHLVLYHGNVSFGRKEMIFDNQNCFIYTTFHLLYRMLERGMVARQPLLHLNESIDEWLGMAVLFMSAYQKDMIQGQTGIIPFCGGAILCTVGMTEYDTRFGYPMERMRMMVATYGKGSSEIPQPNPLEGETVTKKRGSYSIDLNTWISGAQFSLEQEWAVDSINRIKKQHSGILTHLAELVFDPYISDVGKFPEPLQDEAVQFLGKLFKITLDKRWARACSW